MTQRPWFRARAAGLVVGAVVTGLAVVLYAAGRLDQGVLDWLDLHFRHVNRIAASDRILMIDINEYAVERVHRWPWPRSLHADLVSTLNELGARTIVMDLTFPEPTDPRFEHPVLSKDADVDPPQDVRGDKITIDDAIKDDVAFAKAIKSGGNVYLAMYYAPKPPGLPVRQQWREAEQILAGEPLISLERFRRALPTQPGKKWEAFYQQARIRHLLLEEYTLTRDELAERLDTPAEVIEEYLAPVKRAVAREIVVLILAEQPGALFPYVHGRTLPGQVYETLSRDREDILRAYRSVRALQAAVYDQPLVPESLRGHLEQGTDATAPLDILARAALGVGFVAVKRDEDGVVRRLPLVTDIDGHLVTQLGFAVACDLLGIDVATIRCDGDALTMTGAQGREYDLPIDADGKTLLNWHIDRSKPEWTSSFMHLPVTRIMELVANRRDIERNKSRLPLRLAEAVELACGGQEAAYAEYEAHVRRRNELRDQLQELPGTNAAQNQALQHSIRKLDGRIAAKENEALQMLQRYHQQIEVEEPQTEGERQSFKQVRDLFTDLVDRRLSTGIERNNATLQARNRELEVHLRAQIADKVCFVGYTAASVSDFVNVPVYDAMPGVLAHANLVNSFLQGQFPRMAPPWMNIMLIGLAGAAVTVLTASRGPWVSLISVVLIIALLVAGSFLLFAAATFYIASVIAAATVFVCWAFITLYRQLTEERAKRQFSKALAQYTSPAVAAQIAEDARMEDLSPRACQVTCFFSDLQGFTSISERLGAERTRELLNPYLEAMSQVLIHQQAFINKFIGDGIFAFFNPPILPCDDHAVRACQAALDSLTALGRLKSDYAGGPLGEDIQTLAIRIGINSGNVFVGDYGSISKLDYTCIGDTVNLAARLEPANKVFGTRIMISEHTRRQVDGRFELRYLGRLQVVGKREAVDVSELLGRAGQVDPAQLEYAELFGRAVADFQQRRWDDASEVLERCTRMRPDDPAIERYLEKIELFGRTPPPDDWNRSIELTSK